MCDASGCNTIIANRLTSGFIKKVNINIILIAYNKYMLYYIILYYIILYYINTTKQTNYIQL